MESHIRGLAASRRDFMLSSVALAGALALPAGLLSVAEAVAAGQIKDVPRNRTLVTVRGGTEGKHTEQELWSPYVIGSNPQLGGNIIYEPLAFYSAFADKTILWLAESYKYSPDYKELTVKTRPGITWSDGKPFSAEDVAYSLNTLNELGGKVKWGKDVQEVLESAAVVDPNTTLLKFKVPSPRFFNHMLSYKYDIGLHIVPKHIFEGQDWQKFTAFDLDKDWPVTTGPWKVVNVSPTQKVLDRRDSWWGVAAGVGKLPEVERIVLLPDTGEQQLAQGLISNAVDFSTGLQVATFPTVFKGNPNIITYTGRELPYGNCRLVADLALSQQRACPVQQSEVPLGYQLSDQPADTDRRRLGRLVESLAAADARRRRVQGPAALLRLYQGVAREISDQRIQPEERPRAARGAGLEEGRLGHVPRRCRQAVHDGDHQLLRFPVGRSGAGRVAEASGDERDLWSAARHVRPILRRQTTTRSFSATAAASATLMRR